MGEAEDRLRDILIERGTAVKAVRGHREWLKSLEKKYPAGPRGGLHPLIRDARRLQDRFRRAGIAVFLDDLVDRFTYLAARWKQMTDPDVTSSFPYLRYVCANLPDSRPSHREKHGLIFPVDHFFWSLWYPLNGFGCMCDVMSVSARDLLRRGWTVSANRRFEYPMPDQGFDFNIGQILSVEGL